MEKADLEKLIKDYQRGLDYIENTNKESALKSRYIARLKELKEEIQISNFKKEETIKQRGR